MGKLGDAARFPLACAIMLHVSNVQLCPATKVHRDFVWSAHATGQ